MDLFSLWLPIVLSTVFVFLASSIMHMVLPFHRTDYVKMPGENQVMAEIGAQGVGVGTYMFPCPGSMKDWKSPEMIEKYKKGPVGFMTIIPSGEPSMGMSLIQWFIFCLLVCTFAGYVTSVLGSGAPYKQVFRWSGTVAIFGFAVSNLPDSIWKNQRWNVTFKFVLDGLIYGLVTAATFGWLWPEAM